MTTNKTKSKMDYDFDNDTIFIFPKSRIPENYEVSEHIGDFILDLDKNKALIGIEILNVSKVFKLTKTQLSSVASWEFTVDITEKTIKIDVNMRFKIRNKLSQNVISIEKINEDMLSPTHMNLAMC